MHFKEWFEKRIKKMQIPQGEKQETDNNKIYPSSNEVFKKKEGKEETLSEDDNSAMEERKEVIGGGKLDIQLRQLQDQQDYNADHVLNTLYDLPEHWIGKEMKLRIIANRRDVTWVTKRVLEDVERGLINAEFEVKGSDNNLCDVSFVLKISKGLSELPAAVTAINPALSFLLSDIRSEAILRRKNLFYPHGDH